MVPTTKTESEMGYVYVLTNPSIRGVKIGRTDREPADRAAELSGASGIPTPFKVFYAQRVSDPANVEGAVHEDLPILV